MGVAAPAEAAPRGLAPRYDYDRAGVEFLGGGISEYAYTENSTEIHGLHSGARSDYGRATASHSGPRSSEAYSEGASRGNSRPILSGGYVDQEYSARSSHHTVGHGDNDDDDDVVFVGVGVGTSTAGRGVGVGAVRPYQSSQPVVGLGPGPGTGPEVKRSRYQPF